MELVPRKDRENPLKHLNHNLTTIGSSSIAAPGTGYVYVPVYAWVTASAVGSARYTNGTGGSALFEIKAAAGGYAEIRFWEEPSRLLANQCPVIDSQTAGMGVNDFHVWLMKVRGGAGQDGMGQ